MKRLTILLLIFVLVFSSVFAADPTYEGPGTSPKAGKASMDLKLTTSSVLTSPVVLYGFYENSGETIKNNTYRGVVNSTLYLEEKFKNISDTSSPRYGTGEFSVYFYCFTDTGLKGTISWKNLKNGSSSRKMTISGQRCDDGTLVSAQSSSSKETSIDIFSFNSSDGVYKHYVFTGTVETETYTSSKENTYTGSIYFIVMAVS